MDLYAIRNMLSQGKSIYAHDVESTDGVISWNAVEDKNHCYYRVFSSDNEDFIPAKDN